jgi:hypothetical protein
VGVGGNQAACNVSDVVQLLCSKQVVCVSVLHNGSSWWEVACAPASACGCPCCIVSIARSTTGMQLTSHRMPVAGLQLQVPGVHMCVDECVCWQGYLQLQLDSFQPAPAVLDGAKAPAGLPGAYSTAGAAQLALILLLSVRSQRVLSLTQQGVTGTGPVTACFPQLVEGAQGKGHGLSLSGLSMRCCCGGCWGTSSGRQCAPRSA